jgi:hypothetical protein
MRPRRTQVHGPRRHASGKKGNPDPMNTSLRKPVVAFLLFVGALPFIDSAPAALRIVGSIVSLFYLPGLAFLLVLGGRRRPSLDYAYYPFIFSPLIIAFLAFACYFATGSVDRAWTAAPVLPALLILISLFMKRGEQDEAASPVPRAILFISFAFAGIIIIAYLLNAFLLYRIDAWYHIGIVNEIANRGIPPKEPSLADESIRYMWVFHFVMVGFKKFSGLSAPWAMGVFNAINAFVFPYLAARMTVLFRKERRFVLGTPLFALASLSSASWILWPMIFVAAFFGEVKGSAEIARIIHNISIDGNQVVHFLTPNLLWMVNLVDKFFVITAFNFVLNLFLLCFVTIASVDRRDRFDLRATITVFLVILGALLFHIVWGISLFTAVAGSGILLLLARLARLRAVEDLSLFHRIAVPGAAIAAGAVAFPYIMSLMGNVEGGGSLTRHFHIGIKNILTIAAPLLILYPFSRAAFRELRGLASGAHLVLATWLVALGGLNLILNLPASNVSKLVFPVFLLLTPLVAWQIIESLHQARGARLAKLWIIIVVLFVVPPVLTVRGFFLEKPINPIEVKRMSVTPQERELFGWVAANTPIGAVVMEGNIYGWMPVYAQRRNYFPDEQAILILGYDSDPRIGRFREIRDNIFSMKALREDDIAVLAGMKPDLYVVVWREDMERFPGIEERLTSAPGWFTRVYGNPAGAVFRLMRAGAHENEGGISRAGT